MFNMYGDAFIGIFPKKVNYLLFILHLPAPDRDRCD